MAIILAGKVSRHESPPAAEYKNFFEDFLMM
jgi:hypothetical protein